VAFFGSACFKMLRLFIVAAFNVHFFACMFYRVKMQDEPNIVTTFYETRRADANVCKLSLPFHNFHSWHFLLVIRLDENFLAFFPLFTGLNR
jgi:hypothetical protein